MPKKPSKEASGQSVRSRFWVEMGVTPKLVKEMDEHFLQHHIGMRRQAYGFKMLDQVPWCPYDDWHNVRAARLMGYEPRFGPGKSPFKVMAAVGFNLSAFGGDNGLPIHIVFAFVTSLPHKQDKWEINLREIFKTDLVQMFASLVTFRDAIGEVMEGKYVFE